MSNIQRPETIQRPRWAEQIRQQIGGIVYKDSFVIKDEIICFLYRDSSGRFLILVYPENGASWVHQFSGTELKLNLDGQVLNAKQCPTNQENSKALRENFEFTRPVLIGLKKSFGFGDRLGLATPGHILAVRDSDVTPIFAQQSIREMTRTQRSAQEVMDDACWGVFQAGFDKPFGSDADHLKNEADIDVCAKAGFGMFTIDPGDYVDDDADSESTDVIKKKFAELPWQELESSADETIKRYEGGISLADVKLEFSADQIMRAGSKYGRAIAHTYKMYRHLVSTVGEGNFELEVSVDETASPTTPQEHFYVASELKRLGIKWVSLAPRFIGEFEKGVDYIGDLNIFRKEFALHAEIARQVGPYKISIHSGSDKFSIYPIAAELTEGLVHVKTAGTSYLEALRVLAKLEPGLFREILDFARERYPQDRATYHVSADVNKVPSSTNLGDHQLAGLLDDFDAREVLHVTFGSVLTVKDSAGGLRFRDRLLAALTEHEEAYHQCLKEHLGKHVKPFTI